MFDNFLQVAKTAEEDCQGAKTAARYLFMTSGLVNDIPLKGHDKEAVFRIFNVNLS